MKAFFFFVSCILLVATAEASGCKPSTSSCDFYACKEKELQCGPQGYWLGFGKPYCQKFVDNESIFTPRSQVWLRDVRFCLQEKVENFGRERSCNTMYKEAMHSHVACYVDTGFCDLSFPEQLMVYWFLKDALKNIDTWKEAALLQKACAERAQQQNFYSFRYEERKNCDGSALARYDGNFCESQAYLRANIVPLTSSEQVLQKKTVIFLGDTHPNTLIKKWLIRNLEQLKAAGVTHIALEALNSESQELVDAYLKNPKLRPDIVKLIANDWGWLPEEHVQLIDAIHAAGLEVVAIDNRNELDRKGLGNDIQLRNEHMADEIEDALHEPRAGRVVVLTGKLHSALDSDEPGVETLPKILTDEGIASVSVNMESGEEPVPRNITQAFLSDLKQNLLLPSVSGDYFLPLPKGDSKANGVIFISR